MAQPPLKLTTPGSDAFLASIVDSSEDAIISKDLNSVVTTWNQAAERIFGYSTEEMIGQSITLLIPLERQNEEAQILARLQRGERVQHFETIRVRKDGRQIHVSLTISPIKDSEGRIVGASKIARDITGQKNDERALQQAQGELQLHAQNLEKEVHERTAKLRDMVAELDAFCYSLSHDLRAPLRAIQGFAELVLADFGEKAPESVPHLRRIAGAAARMDRLINDVLAFSRIARADIHVEKIDLEALVRELVNEQQNLNEPRASVMIATPLLPVLGHQASLTQCIGNLLDNAVKFVGPGVMPEVKVTTHAEKGAVRLSITDNGIGIDPAAQSRLFRMFERLPTEQRYDGTGIGLAIVRKAAERMNGTVGVESTPGRGSTFWITLPAADAE